MKLYLEHFLNHSRPKHINVLITTRLKRYENFTPLTVACDLGLVDLLRRIVKNPHLDVNKKGPQGRSPLYYAVQSGNTEAISVLATCENLNWNDPDAEGHPPIFYAVRQGYVKMMKTFFNLMPKQSWKICIVEKRAARARGMKRRAQTLDEFIESNSWLLESAPEIGTHWIRDHPNHGTFPRGKRVRSMM